MSDQIVHATIPGNSDEPATPEALARVMGDCMRRFKEEMQRFPSHEEIDAVWAAMQRHFGIPESAIEPPHLRRH